MRTKKNNMKKYFSIIWTISILVAFNSCFDDLDRYPTNDLNSKIVYDTAAGYKNALAKVYGSYALTGNDGTSLIGDISMGDPAATDFIRCYFNLQSMTTEEAICTWTDDGIPDLNTMSWASSNAFIAGLYYRSLLQITLANEFIRESSDANLEGKGFTQTEIENIKHFRAEARFLRAFQYWVLVDLFGNPPFVDENHIMGKVPPKQIERKELFNYIEKELLELDGLLKEPGTNEYGRADKGACWALLARFYLNAEVYTGNPKYTEAITYSGKVLDAGYSLKSNYGELFMADNNLNNNEVILSINYDGLRSRNYGGLTFIINSSFMGKRGDTPDIDFNAYMGMGTGGWYGNRSRKELVERFVTDDSRRLFFGAQSSVETISNFEQGLAVAKFRNVTSTGAAGSNYAEAICDTDFPLFRLAEMHLVYAESVLRGGSGGTMSEALGYINELRRRAFGNNNHDLSEVTLQDILDERSRELYWECFRRTDLIRYGQYTSGEQEHLWQWKGGVKEGRGVASHLNLFPIPASDLTSNPNLKQNPGYSN